MQLHMKSSYFCKKFIINYFVNRYEIENEQELSVLILLISSAVGTIYDI